jgi:hypothetical protein
MVAEQALLYQYQVARALCPWDWAKALEQEKTSP